MIELSEDVLMHWSKAALLTTALWAATSATAVARSPATTPEHQLSLSSPALSVVPSQPRLIRIPRPPSPPSLIAQRLKLPTRQPVLAPSPSRLPTLPPPSPPPLKPILVLPPSPPTVSPPLPTVPRSPILVPNPVLRASTTLARQPPPEEGSVVALEECRETAQLFPTLTVETQQSLAEFMRACDAAAAQRE